MKKILIMISFFLMLTFSTGCNLSLSDERKLSDEQWIEDIECLDVELKKKHPDIFKYTTEKEWNESIEKLKLEVPKLSDTDIKLRISQIVASIGDAHTGILPIELVSPVPSSIAKGENQIDIQGVVEFPIKCEFFDDGLRVIECDSKYKEILGSKIISINEIDINKIINDIATLFSCDYKNEQNSSEQANKYLNIYDFLKFFDIVDNEKAKYEFEIDGRTRIALDIKALENQNIDYINVNKKEMKTNEIPIDESEFYWFKNFEEDNILYFKFNRFSIGDGYGTSSEFYEFRGKLLDEVNKENYEKFVIDLRNNKGGKIKVLESIIEMIRYQTDLKGEDIYVITNKGSYSASVGLAYFLQNEMGANVVGEITGDNINFFRTMGENIELPNSKLKPTYSKGLIVKKEGYNGGVKPDVEIKQDYEDYINGIDTCYEYIKSN